MNDLVVKDNDVIRACYQLSLNEQRLLLIAIANLPKTIDNDIPFSYYEERMYDVYVNDFVKLGVHPNTAYRELEVATERLYHRSIVIKNNGRELKTRWVQTIIKIEEPPFYDQDDFEDQFVGVSLRFSYEILPFLIQLSENFTQYPLKDVAGFRSIYSIRMYELMMQFNSTKYVKIKLSELRSMFELQDKYANSKDLRKWVIEAAFKEINEKSPVIANYKLLKTGKRFTHLEISFKDKSKISDKKSNELIKRDSNTADIFTKYTDAQLSRAVHSEKFIGDYGHLVSPNNPANQSSSAWIAHMVAWLKKDPNNFTKRPIQEYLDDKQAQRF